MFSKTETILISKDVKMHFCTKMACHVLLYPFLDSFIMSFLTLQLAFLFVKSIIQETTCTCGQWMEWQDFTRKYTNYSFMRRYRPLLKLFSSVTLPCVIIS